MIRFLKKTQVLAFHLEQLSEHGGAAGLRDEGLLESALDRARNLFAYEHAPIPALAASVTFGIVKNHPFVDGNKRTGFIAGYLMLRMNGYEMSATEEEVIVTILRLAAGEVSEEELAIWFTSRSQPRS